MGKEIFTLLLMFIYLLIQDVIMISFCKLKLLVVSKISVQSS